MTPLKNSLISSLILSTLLLSACQQRTQDLAPYYPEQQSISGTDESFEINVQKDVDILFVIDDSGSMRNHQTNLANNINRFADSFGKTAIADFQIGVLSNWDFQRYGVYNMESGQIDRPGVVSYISRLGQPNFDLPGRLRPLKVNQDETELLRLQPKNFIRKHDGFEKILRETLKIGVREFEKESSDKKEALGSEKEDLFTPILAALSPAVKAHDNAGFYRPDAHLAIIVVTDANDSSHYSAEEFFDRLVKIKGGDASKVSVHGVVIQPKEVSASCEPDPSQNPRLNPKIPKDFEGKIVKLARLSRGKILSLCDRNFADKLAELGQEIRDRTMGVIEYPLKAIPEVGSITVKSGQGQTVPPGQYEGWSYDDERQVILIRKPARWLTDTDPTINVTYTPVPLHLETSKCLAGCAQR